MSKALWRAKNYCAVVFDSTHHAMAAERALEEAGLDILIFPTPREITVSCALAIRFNCSNEEGIVKVLEGRSIGWNAIYESVEGKLFLRRKKE